MGPTLPSTSGVIRRSRLAAALATTAIVAASACNCDTAPLKRAGAKINAVPNPIVFSSSMPGQGSTVTVKVSNNGIGGLQFKQAPQIVMSSSSAAPVFAVLGDYFTKNCDGSSRNGNNTEIDAGGCATLDVHYLPADSSIPTGTVLRFVSNDAVSGTYDVPIQVLAPHLNVCLEDNSGTETCNKDGMPLNVSFSSLVTVGSTGVKSMEIKSSGTKDGSVMSMSLTGDVDYTTSPDATGFQAVSVAPAMNWPFLIKFKPITGGPRGATLTFKTDDPANPTLTVNITASGDGPALCYCVGSATAPCVTTSTADFGNVGTDATGSMYLEISSCGTKPLTLRNVAITSGNPPFGAMNLPSANMVLAPNSTPLNIPLTFQPTMEQSYTGRLDIDSDAESGYITLTGNGVTSGCDLSGASLINFGSVQVNVQGEQSYAVSNRGTEACTFPQTPAITMGASVKFGLAGFPLNPVAPGQSVVFTVTYTPQMLDSGDTGQLTIYYLAQSASPGATPKTLPVTLKGTPVAMASCVLTATPASNSIFGATLNFGQVQVGTTAILPATFRNVGSSNCTIGAGKLVGGIALPGLPSDLSAFKIVGQPTMTLPPGMTTSVRVAFTPTAQTTYGSPLPTGGGFPGFSDSLQVQTSDHTSFTGSDCPGLLGAAGPAGCAGWSLSGEGVTSQLVVLPSSIDFGSITLGCESRTQVVTLYNVGQIAIHVSGFTIDPAPPPTIFTVIAPPTPIAIPAGQSVTIQVRYSPSQLGMETGTLYINSDAVASGSSGSGSNPYTTVSLTGTGTNESSQTDIFTEPDHSTVDVLWVIDQDSDSMADKIAAIAANAQTFIQTAIQEHTDFHLGVSSVYTMGNLTTNCAGANCTTGSSFSGVTIKPGVLYHGPNNPVWVSSTDPNPAQAFAQEVQLGVSDAVTGEETGLEGMYETLSPPNINGSNNGFLRDAAQLVVIGISDDDDVQVGTRPTAFYAAFLQSLKPNNPQNVVFDFVGGDMPDGCTNGVDGDAPVRYDDVVQRTGGKLYSICNGTAGFNQIASDLGLGSFGNQTRFVLSRPCDPSTLTVSVNGTMLTNGRDFTYNSVQNTINLTTAPSPGSTITATYNTLCM